MKKNKFNFFFKLAFLLIILGLISAYLYLNFAWLLICSQDEMKYNAAIVNQSEPLPKEFLKVFDSLHPTLRHYSMQDQISNQIKHEFLLARYNKNCKCDDLGYTAWNNDDFKFKGNLKYLLQMYPEFGVGLERYSSPEKCYDFWYQYDILYHGRYLKNLNELSVLTLKKPIDCLNNDEILKLIIIRRQPNRLFSKVELDFIVKTQRQIIDLKYRQN